MNRRDFLKSLAAAAGSAAFAQSALAAIPAPAESNVVGYGWDAAGNGWYRIWKIVRGNMSNGFSLSFGDEGLHLTPESRAKVQQSTVDEIMFSCYVKGPDVQPVIARAEIWAEDKGDDWLVKNTLPVEIGPVPTVIVLEMKR